LEAEEDVGGEIGESGFVVVPGVGKRGVRPEGQGDCDECVRANHWWHLNQGELGFQERICVFAERGKLELFAL
jgi:hypothetical protein